MEAGAPAARAAREHVRVMEQSIEEGGDGGSVAEQLAPVLDGTVRGDERRRPLVAPHDDLEQVLRGGRRELAHAEVVEDERSGMVVRLTNVALRVPASWASASSSTRTWASR